MSKMKPLPLGHLPPGIKTQWFIWYIRFLGKPNITEENINIFKSVGSLICFSEYIEVYSTFKVPFNPTKFNRYEIVQGPK